MLPAAWVDSLFARLAVRYGSEWARKWEGLDIAAVKADWAAELAFYAAHPNDIAYALENLPERPPTVAQFRALCRSAPLPKAPALSAPTADPKAAEKLRAASAALTSKSSKEWAYALRRREMACERLTAAQRAAWRQALRHELAAEQAAEA